jgi:3-methyladenine DNA glycosylase AlkC
MEDFKLKNVYNLEFVRVFAEKIQRLNVGFDGVAFIHCIMDSAWEDLELKERMRHITRGLRRFLPQDYAEAIAILRLTALECQGFPYMFFPDFVEQYGLGDEEISLSALELFTQYSSSEFAIRPFLQRNPVKIMAQMLQWATHPNHHVRRFASEGCRPRLPWGMALKEFQRDPAPILPILELLKADDSDYVRRSVANNLNDIAKDHPTLVLDIAERWIGVHPHTDWIVKHGLRTLLKRGNPRAMQLFGFGSMPLVTVGNLRFHQPSVSIGEAVNVSFDCWSEQAEKIRLEYGVYYVKSNGEATRKVFFIHERYYSKGERVHIQRKISFQQRTTRKHYVGTHRLTIIVNGVECAETHIEVVGEVI